MFISAEKIHNNHSYKNSVLSEYSKLYVIFYEGY